MNKIRFDSIDKNFDFIDEKKFVKLINFID